MKRQIIFATLVGIIASSATANLNLKLSLKTPDNAPIEIQKDYSPGMLTSAKRGLSDPVGLVTPAFQNPIHDEDLATSDTTPLYNIKSSGRYYLAGDIFAQRADTATGVIFGITAANVSLNLNSKVIMPHVSSAHTGATAIQVSAGLSNVQIMNGTIQAVDSNGTQRMAKGIEIPTTGTVNNTVKLRNLYVTRLRDVAGITRGFDLNGINDLSMDNCTANDSSMTTLTTVAAVSYGCLLDTVNNFVVRDCEFNNHSATSADTASEVIGLVIDNSQDGIVENVSASNNSCTVSATAASTCQGVFVTATVGASRNIQFNNVKASSNTADSSSLSVSSAGFFINSAPICNFVDCVANNNTDASSGAHPTGFYLASGSDSCSFVRCRAEQNTTAVASSSAYGFRIESDNNSLEDCRANANSGSAASYGIYLSGSTENRVVNCSANYNQSSAAAAYGVFMTGTCNNNRFLNCESNGNQATVDSAAAVVAGFYSTGGSDNVFENCVANGNDAFPDADESGTNASGFRLAGSEARAQLVNCKAIGNRAGDTSSFAYGIYFESTSNCTVKNCYMAHNNVSNGAAFGFADDTATPSTTLLINNLAVGQGKCLGGTLDASLQWANNVKPTSSNQNYFFKHGGSGDDPRNTIQEAPIANFLSISTTVGDWTNISLYAG